MPTEEIVGTWQNEKAGRSSQPRKQGTKGKSKYSSRLLVIMQSKHALPISLGGVMRNL